MIDIKKIPFIILLGLYWLFFNGFIFAQTDYKTQSIFQFTYNNYSSHRDNHLNNDLMVDKLYLSGLSIPVFAFDLGHQINSHSYTKIGFLHSLVLERSYDSLENNLIFVEELWYRHRIFQEYFSDNNLSISLGKLKPSIGGFYYYLEYIHQHLPENIIFKIDKAVLGAQLSYRDSNKFITFSITDGQNFSLKDYSSDNQSISMPLVGASYVHNFPDVSILGSYHFRVSKWQNSTSSDQPVSDLINQKLQDRLSNYLISYTSLAALYSYKRFQIFADIHNFSLKSLYDQLIDFYYNEKIFKVRLAYQLSHFEPYFYFVYNKAFEQSSLSTNQYNRLYYNFAVDYQLNQYFSAFFQIPIFYHHYGLHIHNQKDQSIAYQPQDIQSTSFVVGIKSIIDNK